MDNQKRGAAGLEGGEYQIKLILVSSLRATRVYGDKYKIRTELKDDGKFDDLVLLYRTTNPAQNKEYKRCLQAKHKMNEKNNIALNDLLIDSKKGFNLFVYYKSYINNPLNGTLLKDLIIFTNLKFNENVKKFVDLIPTSDDIFHFGDEKGDGTLPALYRFNEEFREKFKNCKLNKLAEQIILYSHTNKEEMQHNNNSFKDYHNVLAKYVFDVKNKCFHPAFLTSDLLKDPTSIALREILLNKCGLNPAEFDVKLSVGFGANPSDVWPKGTTLSVEEVEKIEMFFKHLIFAVNQPNEEELNTYIHNELKTLYKTTETETDLRASHFIDCVRKWFKEKEISYLSKIEMDQFNESVNRKIEALTLLKISEMFCEELSAAPINFQIINFQHKLNAFLCDEEKSIFYLQAIKNYTRSSSIKMLHALQNSESECKSLFIPLKKDIMRKVMNLISFYTKSTEFIVFAMEVIDVQLLDTIYFQLDKIIEEQKHKKIVIISEEFNLPAEYGAICERCWDETHFNHLSQETRANLFEKEISFQGFIVPLKHVFHENDVTKFEYANWWLPLMFNKEINIGPELQLSNDYNLEYFIPRKSYQMTLIPDEEIAEIRNQDIVVFTSEEYCKQVEENPTKNVHYLIRYPENDVWVWQKTIGEISNIRKHMTNSLTADIIEDTKLQIIADNAGMGKSTIISHNVWEMKRNDPSLWIIRFNLIAFCSELSQFGMTKGVNANEFICEQLLKFPQQSVEETMFYSRMALESNPKMIFVFDGLDEVNEDCQESVISIIKDLLNRTSVKRIIISTRPHLQEKLEDNFSQFAINLHPFTDGDKIDFLIKYWFDSTKKNNIRLQGTQDGSRVKEKIGIFAKQVLVSFSKDISDNLSQFTGFPLQIRMIAEILENDAMDYIKGESTRERDWSSVSIVSIYELFIDKKKEIFIKEKSQFTNSNRIVENALKQTVARINHLHAELAMNIEIKCEATTSHTDNEDIQSMLQFGLVQEKNGKFYFIHQTFAEYYFAILTTAKISLPNCDVKQCLDMFNHDFYSNIRLFINDLITIDVSAYDYLRTHFVSIIRHDTNRRFSENVLKSNNRRKLNLKMVDLILDCIHEIDEENGSSDIITSLFTSTTNWPNVHDSPLLLIYIIETIKSRYDPKCVRFRDLVSFIIQRIPWLCCSWHEEEHGERRAVVKYLIDFLTFIEEQKYLESDFINKELQVLSFVDANCDSCELFLIFLDYVYAKKVNVLLDELFERNSNEVCNPESSNYFNWLETKSNFSSSYILNMLSPDILKCMYHYNNNFFNFNNFLTTVLNHSKAKYGVKELKSISDPSFTVPFSKCFKRYFSWSPCDYVDKLLNDFLINHFGTQYLYHILGVQNKKKSRIERLCLWSRFERLRYHFEDFNEESIREKSISILKALKMRKSPEVFYEIINTRNEYNESILQRACREHETSQMHLISSWIDSDEIFESLTSIKDEAGAFWFSVTLLNLINEKFPKRIEHFLFRNSFVFFGNYTLNKKIPDKSLKGYTRELLKTVLNVLEKVSKDSLFRILSAYNSTFAVFRCKMAINDYYVEGVGRLLELIEKNGFNNDEIFRLMTQRNSLTETMNDPSLVRIVCDFMERHLSAEQITEINRYGNGSWYSPPITQEIINLRKNLLTKILYQISNE